MSVLLATSSRWCAAIEIKLQISCWYAHLTIFLLAVSLTFHLHIHFLRPIIDLIDYIALILLNTKLAKALQFAVGLTSSFERSTNMAKVFIFRESSSKCWVAHFSLCFTTKLEIRKTMSRHTALRNMFISWSRVSFQLLLLVFFSADATFFAFIPLGRDKFWPSRDEERFNVHTRRRDLIPYAAESKLHSSLSHFSKTFHDIEQVRVGINVKSNIIDQLLFTGHVADTCHNFPHLMDTSQWSFLEL